MMARIKGAEAIKDQVDKDLAGLRDLLGIIDKEARGLTQEEIEAVASLDFEALGADTPEPPKPARKPRADKGAASRPEGERARWPKEPAHRREARRVAGYPSRRARAAPDHLNGMGQV